jgi:predicted RNase H-like HicB family nuclease
MHRKVVPQKSAKPKTRAALMPYVYRVTISPDEGRYYAEVPALPGCYSWGHNYEEALKNVKEAVELWLEVKKESGEPIPIEEPSAIQNASLTIGVLA